MKLIVAFANKTILSYFSLFFLITGMNFLISAVIAQILNPNAELAIPTTLPTKEAKVKMVTHPVTVEDKTKNF